MTDVKMFLFARWISICYADEHVDENMISQHQKGYNEDDSMSVLNRESGEWYKKQLDFFNKTVYPIYVKNKTVEDTEKFFNNN